MINSSGESDLARWINWKTVLLWWVFFAVFKTVPVALTIPFTHREIWLAGFFAAYLLFSLLWAAATPLILGLARRFFVSGRRWLRHLIVHVVASGVFSVLILAAYVPLSKPLGMGSAYLPFKNRLVGLIHDFFSTGVMYYAFLVVAYHALHHADRIRKGTLAASRIREQLNHARLELLRARLQPHFLFNTLHTIGALVRLDRKAKALETLSDFGDLLRHSLDYGQRPFVSLGEEISFIRQYLAIEEQRFPDRLRPTYQIQAGTEEIPIPALLLQPLVENAVRHGIGEAPDAGKIELIARRQDHRLDLEIRDDGPGLPEGWQMARDAGFGLSSTVARLEQHYGKDYEFDMAGSRERGLTVRLSIPCVPPAADEAMP